MFFKNLRNGPFKELDEEASETKNMHFHEYIQWELEQDYSSKFFTFLLLFIFIFSVLLPILGSVILLYDLNNVLSSPEWFSAMQQVSLQNASFIVIIFYFLRLLFYILTTVLTIIITIRIVRQKNSGDQLHSDSKMICDLLSKLHEKNPEIYSQIIKFHKKEKKYQLTGFFSKLDPFRTFNAFQNEKFSTNFYLLPLYLWFFTTGIITFFTNSLFMQVRGSELEIDNIIKDVYKFGISLPAVMFIILGFLFIVISSMELISAYSKFRKFLFELIELQEAYIVELMILNETEPNEFNLLLFENERNNLLNLKNYIDIKHLIFRRGIPVLIPIFSVIITIITQLPSII